MARTSDVERRLGPELKRLWLNGLPAEVALDLLVQAERQVDSSIRQDFDRLKVRPRTIAGDVFTLTVPTESLVDLAGCAWVVKLELSRPTAPEPDQPNPQA